MCHQPARFEKSWPPFCQIWIIFTHLKLWIASARHNFKWVKIQIEFGGQRVKHHYYHWRFISFTDYPHTSSRPVMWKGLQFSQTTLFTFITPLFSANCLPQSVSNGGVGKLMPPPPWGTGIHNATSTSLLLDYTLLNMFMKFEDLLYILFYLIRILINEPAYDKVIICMRKEKSRSENSRQISRNLWKVHFPKETDRQVATLHTLYN